MLSPQAEHLGLGAGGAEILHFVQDDGPFGAVAAPRLLASSTPRLLDSSTRLLAVLPSSVGHEVAMKVALGDRGGRRVE
jgi:hypothetical protein